MEAFTTIILILWTFIGGAIFHGWVDDDYDRRKSFEPVMWAILIGTIIATTVRITLFFAT